MPSLGSLGVAARTSGDALRANPVRALLATLGVVIGSAALVAVLWPNERPCRIKLDDLHAAPRHTVLREAARQLGEYFSGSRTTFDLPLRLQGTDFQTRVWEELQRIPYGCTRSYSELARAIGRGSASRAVGLANSRNPLSIIVPCHRVIGASGNLTGFAGGLETKAKLLQLEAGRATRC